MKIVIAGASGFVGQGLIPEMTSRGEVVALSRGGKEIEGARTVPWNPSTAGPWEREVGSADVIINLAGASIGAGRWTAERKKQLVSSRLESTGGIVRALTAHSRPGRLLISVSAVGYYGSRGDEMLTEESGPGSDFLADLCQRWEAAAKGAEGAARVVIPRLGVVFGRGGGALPQMLLPFRMFAGGPIGKGDQWMSWIDRRDVTSMFSWLIDHSGAEGVYNASSPEPVTNREFARTAGAVLSRPSFFPVPPIALRLGLGEMADALLLASQRVVPRRLEGEGFVFAHPSVRKSLETSVH